VRVIHVAGGDVVLFCPEQIPYPEIILVICDVTERINAVRQVSVGGVVIVKRGATNAVSNLRRVPVGVADREETYFFEQAPVEAIM
jgi:hypothetical protein